jgi:hypothetical protein
MASEPVACYTHLLDEAAAEIVTHKDEGHILEIVTLLRISIFTGLRTHSSVHTGPVFCCVNSVS